jgi:hypothetical protein
MKRFAEDVSVTMGLSGEITREVLSVANRALKIYNSGKSLEDAIEEAVTIWEEITYHERQVA